MFKYFSLSLLLCCGGCGLATPRLPEFWAAPGATALKLNNITAQTACELGKAVYNMSQYKVNGWIRGWGAAISLSLGAVERGEVNPALSIVDPLPTAITTFSGGAMVMSPQSFSLGLGLNGSSENTNKSTLAVFYTVPELIEIGKRAGPTCQPSYPAPGYLFSESELGIGEWIYASVGVQSSGLARFPTAKTGPYGQTAISESIKFDIVSAGTLSPQWRLVRLTANTGTNLLSARRQRTQQIDIVFGPMESGQLSSTAYAQLNAQLISAALDRRLGN